MSKKRRTYSREFKLEAIELLKKSGESAAQIERELGITAGLLSRWKRKFEADGDDAFPGNGKLKKQDAQIRELKRENERLRGEREIFKKPSVRLRRFADTTMKFEFIDEHRDAFAVTRMCDVQDVSTSGYYTWRDRSPSQRDRENQELLTRIREIHEASRRTYGSPRIHAELRDQGIKCNIKRVERLMRENDIRAKQTKSYRTTTDSDRFMPVAPNRLDQNFDAEAPNTKWLSDITYIPTDEGWLYLAIVMDLYSRRIVGWAMDMTLASSLTKRALTMAIAQRRPTTGLLHHSDRGAQYASGDYQALLDDHEMTPTPKA